VLAEAYSYVQTLNSRFTDPSGHSQPRRGRRGNDAEKPPAGRIAAAGRSAAAPLQVSKESAEPLVRKDTVTPPADFVPEERVAGSGGDGGTLSSGERR
jgi:hypothetical protein